jgi:ADP-ribosyl-[dinitrogen reductase] hydrolase
MPAPTAAFGAILARAEAAYLGLALGDALGATVEFMTPREIAHHYGIHREIVGGGWLRLKAGQVTDDTGMSLALGEAIIANAGRVVPLACANAFDAWMRSKPIDIGNTVRRNLVTFRKTGVPVAPESDHDAGNGAAMRVLPVALATFGAIRDGGARSRARARARDPQQRHLGCRVRVPDADGAGLSARGHPAGGGLPAHRAFGGEASGVVVRRPPSP